MSNQGIVSARHVDHFGMTVPNLNEAIASSRTRSARSYCGVSDLLLKLPPTSQLRE